ncbi:MAG: hypothetical protein U9O98_04280, partial [Asgard group archaeon]|nr:hypothetical protein [Asgard group archaeon]
FVGNHLSFFPVGLFVILGIIGGYLIALYKEEKISYKIIQYFGFGFGFTFLIAFVIHIIIDVILAADPIPALIAIFDYQFYPRELLFFAVGSMCLLFLLFIKKLEFIPAEMKTKLKQRTKLIRDFGKVTLTLYIMEAFINGGLAVGFHAIFGDITVPYGEIDAFMTNPWAIILFVLTFSLFWVAFVYFWSKIDFKYGFEHFNNLLTKNLRSVNSLRSFNNQSSDEASSMQKNPD